VTVDSPSTITVCSGAAWTYVRRNMDADVGITCARETGCRLALVISRWEAGCLDSNTLQMAKGCLAAELRDGSGPQDCGC
jgi:hypothetical protein